VLVPGLAANFSGIAPDAFISAPALSRLLSKSDRHRFPASTLETAVLSLCDVPFNQDSPPIGPFSACGDMGAFPGGYCLCAAPVHLRADTRGLILFDGSTFSLSEPESAALSAAVQDLLAEDGWHLHAPHPKRWYLCSERTQDLNTIPLALVRGRPVADYLPAGQDGSAWLNRLNELQMVLHTHPVNERRAAQGLPVINSLWLWGGGVLPAPADLPFDRMYTDDVFVRGLGRWGRVPCEALPADIQTVIDRARHGERILLVYDGCREAASYETFLHWNETVALYERACFSPLLKALARRKLPGLELVPVNNFRYVIEPRQLWRFWRRLHPYRETFQKARLQ
jgi:hypothetical protein